MSSNLSASVKKQISKNKIKLAKPSMTTRRLFQAILRPNIRGEMILRLIQENGALVAGVLKAANGGNAMSQQFHSLRGATSTSSGARQIARVGIAVSMAPLYKVSGYELSAEQIWLEARLSAIYAEEFARRMGEPTEMSFACGLLMNAGELLTLNAIGLACDEISTHASPEMVIPLLKKYRGMSGPRVAKGWKMPKPIAMAMGDLSKISNDDAYMPFIRAANLGYLMAQHGGKPEDAVFEKNVISHEARPIHLIKSLGSRHREFVERAKAMGGTRRIYRHAA